MARIVTLPSASETLEVAVPGGETVELSVALDDGAVERMEEFALRESESLDGLPDEYGAALRDGDMGRARSVRERIASVMGEALEIACGDGYARLIDALGVEPADAASSVQQVFAEVMGMYAERSTELKAKAGHYLSEAKRAQAQPDNA